MARIKLKFVVEDVDRPGNVRRYFRRRGQKKIRLLGQPGSQEFNEQYSAALAGASNAPRQSRSVARGSFRHLCILYYGSAAFTGLDVSTQSWQRRALDRICEDHAVKPVAQMLPKHVRQL